MKSALKTDSRCPTSRFDTYVNLSVLQCFQWKYMCLDVHTVFLSALEIKILVFYWKIIFRPVKLSNRSIDPTQSRL